MFCIRPSPASTLIAALFAAACSSSTAPEAGIEIRPSAPAFTRTTPGSDQIPYSVLNTGAKPVLITTRCGDRLTPSVQRREGGQWLRYSGDVCITMLPMGPVPIAAGARREDVAFVAEAGQYRLVLGTEHGPVVSSTFTVR